jgi:hypothetical protein
VSNLRSTAVAVVLALSLGGTVLQSSASSTSPPSSFVAITPCRLVDTRAGSDNVGPRSTPVHAGETFIVQATGTSGGCAIPPGATAMSMNVTVVGPTAPGFLTVFPADQPRPTTANLVWVARQAPTPNAVTSALSTLGTIGFFNLAGDVDVIADVVGYFQSGTPGPPGPPGPKGDPGSGAHPAQIVWVAASGGDFTSVAAAVASITDASPSKPYLVRIAPGTYVEPGGVDVKNFIDIQGSGEDLTTISCDCGSTTSPAFGSASATLRVADFHPNQVGSTISDLQVLNTSASIYTTAVWIGNQEVTLRHVTAVASGGSGDYAVWVQAGSATLSFVTARSVSTDSESFGVTAESGIVALDHSTVLADDSSLTGYATGVFLFGSGAVISDTTVTAAAPNRSYGALLTNSSLTATRATLGAQKDGAAFTDGVVESYGLDLVNTTATVTDSTMTGTTSGMVSDGLQAATFIRSLLNTFRPRAVEKCAATLNVLTLQPLGVNCN